jgi:tetratricopeptide (TPR) repeat protein
MTFQRGGEARIQRFLRLRERDDLDQGIAIWQRALREVPEGRPDRAAIDNNLGKAHLERWKLLASSADLDCAVQHFEAAVKRTPPGHPHRAMHTGNLGVALRERASSEGDLRRALDLLGEAVSLCRRGTIERCHWLHQAALGLHARWRAAGDLRDLSRAVGALTESCELSPLLAPELSDRLTTLADMLREGHARGGPATMLADAAWAEDLAACLARRPKGG